MLPPPLHSEGGEERESFGPEACQLMMDDTTQHWNLRTDESTDRPTDVSAYLPIEGTLI